MVSVFTTFPFFRPHLGVLSDEGGVNAGLLEEVSNKFVKQSGCSSRRRTFDLKNENH